MVAVVVGTGTGSTRVEGSTGLLVELLAGLLVVVVSVNRGVVAVRLTGTGTGTGPTTTDLLRDCVHMRPSVLLMYPSLLSISPFYPDDGSLPLCNLLPSSSTQ